MRLPLRRLLSVFLSFVPQNLTLLSAPFIPDLSSHPTACFVVWIFHVLFWLHRSELAPTSILSIVASNVRRRISADWQLARRHRPTTFTFSAASGCPLVEHLGFAILDKIAVCRLPCLIIFS
jgi:hypothetical protein